MFIGMGMGVGVGGGVPPDVTAPTLSSAALAADGATLTLTWSESVTRTGSGSVSLTGGNTAAYSSGSGTAALVYTLATTVLSGATVTVTASAGLVQDAAGNANALVSGGAVTNNSTQTAPTVSSRTVLSNGTTLRLVFDSAVSGFSAGAEGFALTGLTGGATTLTYSSGNNSTTVDFTISRTVASSETSGVLAYTAGDIVKTSGGAPLQNFSAAAVTNSSSQAPPTVSSKTVNTGGTTLSVVFSSAVTNATSGAEGFALTGLTGGATTLTYSSGNGTTTLVFTISRTVYSYETSGVLAYTAGDIAGTNGLALANFSNSAVTNSSTQTAPPSVRNVSTGTGTGQSSAVTLPTRSSGDTLVVGFGCQASVPAANTGWTRRVNELAPDGLTSLAVYTRQSDGTDNTPVASNFGLAYGYVALSIQNPATGYDTSASAAGPGMPDANITAPTVTTTGTNDVLISFYLSAATGITITVPNGQTATTAATTTLATLRAGYQTLSASGATGDRVATQSPSSYTAGANVAVK